MVSAHGVHWVPFNLAGLVLKFRPYQHAGEANFPPLKSVTSSAEVPTVKIVDNLRAITPRIFAEIAADNFLMDIQLFITRTEVFRDVIYDSDFSSQDSQLIFKHNSVDDLYCLTW